MQQAKSFLSILAIIFILAGAGTQKAVALDKSTWKRFWWWTANTKWPAGITDVLKDSFGTCAPNAAYCFQRLPPWASEDHTELLAVDNVGTVYEWKFDSKNPTAHAAWLAFHLHQETPAGKIKHSTPWNPIVREGTAPKQTQDSFMYRVQNNVKSLLLDDDNCDCLSTLSMGHGMCNAGHSTSYGKANVYGVDKLYDPGCNAPKPSNGLTLYFRTFKPLTITGYDGGWRAFWWWSKDGLWPSKVKDVLQSNYGTCSKYDYYCFQRLPKWLKEDTTQILAVDSQGTAYKWHFNSSNPTSHAVWRAFHGHQVTLAGKVVNSRPWNPIVLSGKKPKAVQDSFMYREQNGVRSLLLDDDNCDCLSTLNLGHGMCLSSHQTKFSKANSFGADALYDPSCHGPVPGIGLTLYYRAERPSKLDLYGGNWIPFWWWTAGNPWPNCNETGSKIVDVLENPYGVCTDANEYCFQRLPTWAVDHVTELLALDLEGNVYKWTFDHVSPTSKAAWNAFHNHKETPYGAVKNNASWDPVVLKGKGPIVSQDSFMYRSQSGIKSLLLDDDNCDCLSTIDIGHAMCGKSSTSQATGVDTLYDPHCQLPSPNNGLTMYFRTPAFRTYQYYGHTWTAFWWWPKDGTWPTQEKDVLKHPYGTCKDHDVYCFQRLPSWAIEDHTKLLAIDSDGTVFMWKFSSLNPTAHAMWKAFHGHIETKPGAVLNNKAWNPIVLEGKRAPRDQDSFYYSDHKGIKSVHLDDDNGYCMNTLSLGGDNSAVHKNQFGVDLLDDTKCDKNSRTSPFKGLALYYATARPMTSCSHGGDWLTFWWWNAGATWPTNKNDVLGSPYGQCGPQDLFCFGRIASWATEDNTELLAVDSQGNEYLWKFSSKNPVAHAAWRAFHDHVATPAGSVLNKVPAWNPKVLKGTKPKALQDSFMYRKQNGIKSLLLDDDNCDCLSTLSMGHGMCKAGHSTKYSKTGVKGVDVLSDPGCNGPRPEIGLTLYFRSR